MKIIVFAKFSRWATMGKRNAYFLTLYMRIGVSYVCTNLFPLSDFLLIFFGICGMTFNV